MAPPSDPLRPSLPVSSSDPTAAETPKPAQARTLPYASPPYEPEDESPLDPTALDPTPVTAVAGPTELPPASIRSVLLLAYPTIIEQILYGAIGFTDTFVAGRSGDGQTNAAAAAAVGTMTYLQWLAGILTSALAVGATAIVARSIGARRYRVANRVAGTAVTAAFGVGLLVAIVLFSLARPIVSICGLHGLAGDFGLTYLRIMTITICLQTSGQVGMACLRGAGDTFRSMLITSAVAVVNLIAVPTFAWGLGWGIRGNALGTMLAFSIAGIATLAILLSGRARLKLRRADFRIVTNFLGRILSIGLPSWAEGLLLWVGQFVIVIFIINTNDAALAKVAGQAVTQISGTTMAAHTDVLRIESFAFLPGFGFGIAASALVGQYLGARRPDQAKRAAHIANRLALVTMTIAALPMVLIPTLLLHLVVKSPRVAEVGYWPMILAGLAQPGFAIAITMSSALKGAGETVRPMLATVSGMFLIRGTLLGLAWWIFFRMGHPEWGLTAVWIGIFADLNYRAIVNTWVFLRGRWVHIKV